MKKARYGTTPIPMPKIPSSITALPMFASEVLKSLRALRDRPVLVPSNTPRPSGGSHPFKVSPNGDDTVSVAPGNVIDFSTSSNGLYDGTAVTGDFTAYAGGDVTITADGTVYLVITYDNTNLISQEPSVLADFALSVTSLAVEFDPTLSINQLSIPIAEVTFADNVASVSNQILTHNPILQLGFTESVTP
jgi:hypothetical protein